MPRFGKQPDRKAFSLGGWRLTLGRCSGHERRLFPTVGAIRLSPVTQKALKRLEPLYTGSLAEKAPRGAGMQSFL